MSRMRGRAVVLAVLACVVVIGSILHFFRGLVNLQKPLGSGKSLSFDLSEVDVVNMKNSLPEKVLEYLDFTSNSHQDYEANCCAGIYLNVRTSSQTQERRLPVIVTTWMQTILPSQVEHFLSGVPFDIGSVSHV